MRRIIIGGAAGLSMAATTAALAATRTATINAINAAGTGPAIGMLTLRDTGQGLLIEPKLNGLPPGRHGFHVHEAAACGSGVGPNGQPAAGLAAGGHYDPAHTAKHRGPLSTEGHKGDLPVLVVDADGTATLPVLAPHLKVSDVVGHAIVVHAGGDNYDDTPAPLGGGGARIGCGVVK